MSKLTIYGVCYNLSNRGLGSGRVDRQRVDHIKEVRFVMDLKRFRTQGLVFLSDFTKKPCESGFNH